VIRLVDPRPIHFHERGIMQETAGRDNDEVARESEDRDVVGGGDVYNAESIDGEDVLGADAVGGTVILDRDTVGGNDEGDEPDTVGGDDDDDEEDTVGGEDEEDDK
jgi:hypothetical protein